VIKLTVYPVYTTVSIDPKTVNPARAVELMHSVCMARPEGFQFMPSYKNKRWDGYIKLFSRSQFPSGLVRLVLDLLQKEGYNVEAVLKYSLLECSEVTAATLPGITLRDYQIESANLLLQKTRGIARMATGSGKTEVIAALLKCIPTKAVVLTTKVDLLYQTAERLSLRLEENIGRIGDGLREVERVTVATIQTLSNPAYSKLVSDAGVVIFDECHHVPSKTSQGVMLGINAAYRYGFSGTPLNNGDLNDLLLIAATGPVVYDLPASELIELGMAAKPVIEMHPMDLGELSTDYQEQYSEVVLSPERNVKILEILESYKYDSALVLVERLEHGQLLYEMLPNSIYANGSMDSTTRQAALDSLRQGNRTIVIATPIFDEGVDVPAVDLVILAGAGKSAIRLMQRIGRGMRPKADGRGLIIIDFIDSGKYLLKQSYERAKFYESEGFEVVVKDA
jgi:superfamily II DNA or RNA helicase